jgi:phenylalanyl-tRNA synthetase beta chain
MPKIEISCRDLLALLGEPDVTDVEFLREPLLTLKAELETITGDTLKIELKDTNRPDLWCVEGIARGLRALRRGSGRHLADLPGAAALRLLVDSSVCPVRPWIAAFAARGPALGASAVDALIASQEKLAGSFGRNRKTAAIGFYRLSAISFPVSYSAVPPGTVFHPLGEPSQMSLAEVLTRTETGAKYAGLLSGHDRYPLISDAAGRVLSFPPVLNSEDAGRIGEGDRELFCEVTGTDWHAVNLTATILACNLEDRGFAIEPVEVAYPSPSPGGSGVSTPLAYHDALAADYDLIASVSGRPVEPVEIEKALDSMDYASFETGPVGVRAVLPPYRHDGMHPVDLVEDIVVAMGFDAFPPLLLEEFTVGASAPVEDTVDALRTILIGLGCEELLLPILQSADRPGTAGPGAVAIRNPMTSEYSAVRNSLLPGLLASESASGHASYPHRLFEAGEVLSDSGGRLETSILLACASFGNEVGIGDAHSILGALCGFRNLELVLEPAEDPRFIPGRCAEVVVGGMPCGFLGEFSPSLLSACGIPRPGSAFEVCLVAFGRA